MSLYDPNMQSLYDEIDDLQHELIELEKKNDVLMEVCKSVLGHLQYAHFDYKNGVTDPSGMYDEGAYYGWKAHGELIEKLKVAIGD